MIGSRLGPYEIVSALGAGGMGEVYRAKDSRLGRDVALKVLPADMARDPDRRARFEREARAVAALSHPNILAIHDLGTDADTLYVVTELLDGETLADRLRQGALPVRKATEIAVAVARGLSAAHGKGIAHRDLKPANIFLLADGQVKILDFGLAREMTAASGATETQAALTDPGTVLGTAGYMAPEQIRGQQVDGRADLFALGIVLYEMLTGTRAFARETTAETLTAILKEDPPELTTARTDLPPALDRIVRHALEKNPAERFQSARDVIFALDALLGSSPISAGRPTIEAPADRTAPSSHDRKWAAATILALALGAAGGWWVMRSPSTTADAPSTGPTFKRLTFQRGYADQARFARDGRTIVYGAFWEGGQPEVYMTSVDNPESRALGVKGFVADLSSAGELAVVMDPYFWGGPGGYAGTLGRVSLTGGAPRMVSNDVWRAGFSPDGQQLAIVRRGGGRFSVEFPIGTTVHESSAMLELPAVSPDATSVAFVQSTGAGFSVLIGASGQPMRTLLTHAGEVSGMSWAADGRELWLTIGATFLDSQLFALDLNGRLRSVVQVPGTVWLRDVGPDGRVLVDRLSLSTRTEGLPAGATTARDFSWHDGTWATDVATDGSALVFMESSAAGGQTGMTYVRNTDGAPPVQLGQGRAGQLSPDGRSVAVVRGNQLVLLPVGPGQERALRTNVEYFQKVAWTPDGRALVFSATRAGEPRRLFVYDLGSNEMKPLSPPGVGMDHLWVGQLRVSPDGRRTAALDGDGQVVTVSLADGQTRRVAGTETREMPIGWTADSRSIYVYTPQTLPSRVFVVDVETGRRTLWREIVPRERFGVFGVMNMVITPDGRSWFYSFQQAQSELFLIEGLK